MRDRESIYKLQSMTESEERAERKRTELKEINWLGRNRKFTAGTLVDSIEESNSAGDGRWSNVRTRRPGSISTRCVVRTGLKMKDTSPYCFFLR